MNKPKRIIRYKRIDNLLAAFLECPVKHIKNCTLGYTDGSKAGYEEIVESIKLSKIWGYVQEGIIRYWTAQDCPEGTILGFLAHEIGHMNGKKYRSTEREEEKAQTFQEIAEYAYEQTLRIKSQ